MLATTRTPRGCSTTRTHLPQVWMAIALEQDRRITDLEARVDELTDGEP